MNIVELDCRLSGGPWSILVILSLIYLDVFKKCKKRLGMKSRCINVWGANCLFLFRMNFKDGRFQECPFQDFSGDCGTGARRCESCAIGEVRDASGHPLIRIWMLQIFHKFLDVKYVMLHPDLPFICVVFKSAWTLLNWIADWAGDLCQSWSSLISYILMSLKHVKRDLGWNPDASRFEVPVVCFWFGWISKMVGFKNVEMVFLGQVPDAAVAAPSTKPEIPQAIRCGRFRSFRSF